MISKVNDLVHDLYSAEDLRNTSKLFLRLSHVIIAVIQEAEWRNRLDPEYLILDKCRTAVDEDNELAGLIESCSENDDWNPLFDSGKLDKKVDPPTPISPDQKKATEDSWLEDFQGEGTRALTAHIGRHAEFLNVKEKYHGNFCAIVQSSGMGKSRLVDEFSKQNFVIPINLRPEKSQGYPPADNAVRSYFMKERSTQLWRDFLEALFKEAGTKIKSLKGRLPERAQALHSYFRDGMTFETHGEDRVSFYRRVVQSAEAKNRLPLGSTKPSVPNDEPMIDALKELIKATAKGKANGPVKKPAIYLYFDEAHFLSDGFSNTPGQSLMAELRQILYTLKPFALFTLFSSTTGKISSMVSSHHPDSSARVQQRQLLHIPAFTDLGFDQFAHLNRVGPYDDGSFEHYLHQVTEISFMTNFGRPLWGSRAKHFPSGRAPDSLSFAKMKVINSDYVPQSFSIQQKLAVLSLRLALELNSRSQISLQREQELVEGHLRLCLDIDEESDTMTTLSPSEPLVAEAAARWMMEEKFESVQSMMDILSGFSIHQGDRGELVAMFLLTLARDNATVAKGVTLLKMPDLISSLFSKTAAASVLAMRPTVTFGSAGGTFGQTFARAGTHFNHFIKAHEWDSFDAVQLLRVMHRGAFVLCANSQPGIDFFGAGVLDIDKKISKENSFVLMAQVKNDPKYKLTPDLRLFDQMDPFELEIIGRNDDVAKSKMRFIRIVFALASPEPGIKIIEPREDASDDIVSYDIWCAGISPAVFLPVKEVDEDRWTGLVNASSGWKKFYHIKSSRAGVTLRRGMNAAAGKHSDFWNSWSAPLGPAPPPTIPAPSSSTKQAKRGKPKK